MALLLIVTLLSVYKSLSKPVVKVAKFIPRHSGVRHYLFEKIHPFVAAVFIGMFAFFCLGSQWDSWKNSSFKYNGPANIILFITSGEVTYVNWGVFLVLGIMFGSYSIAAKGSREFRWRLPDLNTLRNSVIGGLLMGVGASLAGGCTIGNGLTANQW